MAGTYPRRKLFVMIDLADQQNVPDPHHHMMCYQSMIENYPVDTAFGWIGPLMPHSGRYLHPGKMIDLQLVAMYLQRIQIG